MPIDPVPIPAAAGAPGTAPGLSARLRTGTRDLHREAERAGAMAALLRGELDAPGYVALLANLQLIYQGLEQGLQPQAAGLALPLERLSRGPAIAQDLAYLGLPLPAVPAEATRRYLQRLQALADGAEALAGPRLMAHAYVRYLGDLHGGQVLRQRVARLLGLTGEDGTRFYDFGPAEQVDALIRRMRTALDALPLNGPEVSAVVDEARLAFRLHVELFRQLPH